MQWATKDAFFAAKVPQEQVDVPSLGRIVVWGLTSGEKDDYENNVFSFSGRSRQMQLRHARAVLLLMTVHDQHGKRMFGEADMGRLEQIPANIADPILDVARRLSGMKAGEVEELAKNSATVQSEDSTSA
jgi:hypothetical protein